LKAETYLDGVLKQSPDGISQLTQEIFYDDELKGMFMRLDNDLTFFGDAYGYISNLVLTQGMCNSVDLLLKIGNDSLSDYFEGIIHLTDISAMNVSRESIRTPIADNNLSSYIFNNKNVKAYISANKTKSGDTAIAATNLAGFDLFKPSNGLYLYSRDNVYTVDQAFSFLVKFMSDNLMTYSSPFFGTGGKRVGLVIASANHLATNADLNPYLSFEELFSEMNKLFNLSMRIDYTGALPDLIIDLTDNLYIDTPLQTFTELKDLLITFEKGRFYSRIDIGSKVTQDYGGGTFTMPNANFLGFKEETYYLTGQCNIDRTLDLVNKFILDSNIIEDILVNQNDSYDETVVIIDSDYPVTSQAHRYDNIISGATFVYNLNLSNFEKSVNYLGAIPNDMVLFITNEANNFDASKTSYTLGTGTLIHPTVISDPGGNYNNILGRFTCPGSATGSYSFTYTYTGLNFPSGAFGGSAGSIRMRHYDSAAVLLAEVIILDFTITIVIIDFGGGTTSFELAAGDYVEVYGTAGLSGSVSFSGSHFRGNYIGVEGGIYQTYDNNDFKIMNISFETPLTQAEFINIRDNITKKVTAESGSNTFKGWVKTLSRNIMTGMSKITLISSNNTRA